MLRASKRLPDIISLCTRCQKFLLNKNALGSKSTYAMNTIVNKYSLGHSEVRNFSTNLQENLTQKSQDPDLEVLTSAKTSNLETKGIIPGKGPPPEAPVYCCMSGCANCVWLEYADELLKYYKDGGPMAVKAVKEYVEDPNLRSFILLELQMKGIKS